MSIRAEQVASSIRASVQMSISRGLNDPRIRGLVTVTGVRVTEDLAEAFVDVSVLPERDSLLTMHGLKNAAGRIRADVSKSVRMRTIPRLTFRLDDSLKKQARIDEAIRHAVAGSDDSPEAVDDAEGDEA